MSDSRQAHWDSAYATKGEGVVWFEDVPVLSLDLIRQSGATAQSSLVDIGGGASRLVDALLRDGMRDVAVLDLSATALDAAKARLGAAADDVEWIAADVTVWETKRVYDFWHDRATFHFLTEPDNRSAYIERSRGAKTARLRDHCNRRTYKMAGAASGLPVSRSTDQQRSPVS